MKHADTGILEALEYPAPEKPTGLAVLLHGYGGNAGNCTPLARLLQAWYPTVEVVSLQGPVTIDAPGLEPGHHRTWDDAPDLPRLILRGAFNRVAVAPRIERFIEERLAARGLPAGAAGLFGFSLGGAVAAGVALQRETPLAALACHSSSISPFTRIRSRPGTLLVMGEEDFLYTSGPGGGMAGRGGIGAHILRAGFKAVAGALHHDRVAARLRKNGVPVTEMVVSGLGHAMSPQTTRAVARFLGERLSQSR